MDKKSTSHGAAIKALMPGQFATLEKVEPSGSLEARRLSTGTVKFYWRFTFASKTTRVEIGPYDSKLPPKSMTVTNGAWSIAAAKAEAGRLATEHGAAKANGGHVALMKEQADAKARAIAAKADALEQAAADKAQRAQYNLKALLTSYWENLERLGRKSHLEAKSILSLHAITAWPNVASLPAASITDEQIADMLRRLFEAGHARTANKLRAYLSAAYAVARSAKTNPMVPMKFKGYGIRHNPAADTAANTSANQADKNPLSADELRDYWTAIKELPGIKGNALRLHLLTGGQRIEQLVRLRCADVTDEAITIFDGKGRPGRKPRQHTLPANGEIANAVATLNKENTFAFSTDSGKTHIANTTLSQWAVQSAPKSIVGFKTKRIRSGVETLLASVGISKDARGRLQSHGISGVQDTHYDAHDYMADKRIALDALYRELTKAKASNVVALKAA